MAMVSAILVLIYSRLEESFKRMEPGRSRYLFWVYGYQYPGIGMQARAFDCID